MQLIAITDDLTGAADSGSYFTSRGQKLRICTSGSCSLSHEPGEILSVNLSSRNIGGSEAKRLHQSVLGRLPDDPKTVWFKKIGTGFRGNDAFELEGLLAARPDHLVFLIDHAPDLGTFTLYGHQYCEGVILPKSVYAQDPILPPTKSYIPDILARDTRLPVGLVDIDAVKGGYLERSVADQIAKGAKILVFDAITREDTQRILSTLFPLYPNVFWTGSLGLADGLAQYLFGDVRPARIPALAPHCLGFCASAYEIAKRQIQFSAQRGLCPVQLDVDAYLDGDEDAVERAVEQTLDALRRGNGMLVPHVDRYSYQPGTSQAILECLARAVPRICKQASFDRLVIVGGETSQTIFKELGVEHLRLGRALEPGVAQGRILDGVPAGKEFTLKGGSMGSLEALEKMMGRQEVECECPGAGKPSTPTKCGS